MPHRLTGALDDWASAQSALAAAEQELIAWRLRHGTQEPPRELLERVASLGQRADLLGERALLLLQEHDVPVDCGPSAWVNLP